MKYTIEVSTKFKKDYKIIKKRGYDTELLKEVIDILADGRQLPQKYSDHALSGNFTGLRECHITPIGCLFTELKKSVLS